MAPDWLILGFLFALGASVGSFLNVVVYRLPLGLSLVHPPSRCPRCENRLAWRDNVPVFGWIFLRGRCRYCQQPISIRYPIVELVTGLLFVFYFLALFRWGLGPCGPGVAVVNPLGLVELDYPRMQLEQDAILFAVYLYLVASLLAASLIDAEHFIIPLWLCWLMAIVGVVGHALGDRATSPGSLVASVPVAAAAIGGAAGLVVSNVLVAMGTLPRSFADAMPLLEHEKEKLARQKAEACAKGETPPDEAPDFTPAQLRAEMGKEMAFLLPPMLGVIVAVGLAWQVPGLARWFADVTSADWLRAALGAVFGGLVGGFVVWLTRILGSLAFRREAMGLGDVHLMFGVGAILGAVHATVAFFLAPFFGLLLAVWMLVARRRRELPYGPYLSLASAAVLVFYCSIANYPGLEGLAEALRQLLEGSAR